MTTDVTTLTIPFDEEKAGSGNYTILTRSGYKVDLWWKHCSSKLIGVMDRDGYIFPRDWEPTGNFFCGDNVSDNDLVLLPPVTTHISIIRNGEAVVTIHKDGYYDYRDAADIIFQYTHTPGEKLSLSYSLKK